MAQGQSQSNPFMSTKPYYRSTFQADIYLRDIYDYLDYLGEMPRQLAVGKVVVKGALEMEERCDQTEHYISDFFEPLKKARGGYWDFQCRAIVSVAEDCLRKQLFLDLNQAADFMNKLADVSCTTAPRE